MCEHSLFFFWDMFLCLNISQIVVVYFFPQAPDTDASGSAAPTPDCTPVWEDTPSQSVDGTEVVTQPQDAQEQLDKYHAARAEREARHKKDVKAYERRKSLRNMEIEPSPPVVPVGAAGDVPVSPPRQLRQRKAVAKRKVVRPTRGCARMGVNTIATSTSDDEPLIIKRCKVVKRLRTDDKTFSPDEETDDDASHAGNVKEEVWLFSYLGINSPFTVFLNSLYY